VRALVSIGAVPAYQRLPGAGEVRPYGMALWAREDGPLPMPPNTWPKFAALIRGASARCLDRAAQGPTRQRGAVSGDLRARNLVPWEWSVIRRCWYGRSRMILPDNGLWIISRCAARNAAEVVLKVVTTPRFATASLQRATTTSSHVRQWAEAVAGVLAPSWSSSGSGRAGAVRADRACARPTGRPHITLDNTKAKLELGYRQVVPAAQAFGGSRSSGSRPTRSPAEDYRFYPGRFDYAAGTGCWTPTRKPWSGCGQHSPDEAPDVRIPMPTPRRPAVGRTRADDTGQRGGACRK